ncbi:MAG: hypothetical protein U9Q85_00890 [Patescibacteria group bacterium]|nr:hypothetical protein [Patescibacteria group bacterium]
MEEQKIEQCDKGNDIQTEYQVFGEEFVYALLTATVASTFAIINVVQYIA